MSKFKVKTIIVGPFMQNCRFIFNEDTREAVVVDPGDDALHIIDKINELKLQVKALLLTHGHIDHVGAVQALSLKYQVPILGPQSKDAFLLENLNYQANLFGLPPATEITNKVTYLDKEEVIEPIAGLKLQVLKTPGHTPGGLCYLCPSEKFILVGDTLFRGSVGRTDLKGGSTKDLLDSIHEKILPLEDEIEVLSGHGPDSTMKIERRSNPYLQDFED